MLRCAILGCVMRRLPRSRPHLRRPGNRADFNGQGREIHTGIAQALAQTSALVVRQRRQRLEAPFRPRADEDHAVGIGHQHLLPEIRQVRLGVAHVHFHDHRAEHVAAVANGMGEVISAQTGRATQREVAPGLSRHRLLKVGSVVKEPADEGASGLPVARGDGQSIGIHDIDVRGAGDGSGLFERSIQLRHARGVVWSAQQFCKAHVGRQDLWQIVVTP